MRITVSPSQSVAETGRGGKPYTLWSSILADVGGQMQVGPHTYGLTTSSPHANLGISTLQCCVETQLFRLLKSLKLILGLPLSRQKLQVLIS